MKKASFGITVLVAVAMASYAAEDNRNKFGVYKDSLRRGAGFFSIHAITAPDLAKPTPSIATMAPPLNKIAATGASGVCFDLYGFSPDGAALSQEGVQALRLVVGQTTWRRLGPVCRVFGPDAPEDEAGRMAAARAAGKALSKDNQVVYLIDGAHSGALAKAFLEEAPGLVVAAPEGGNVALVTEEPKERPDVPVILMGKMPEKPTEQDNYILPADEASYALLDRVMAKPVESQPWTPDNSILSEQERQEGFIALFDGKTLDGWWIAGMPNGFVARDGNIEWERAGGGAILTRDRYENFILRLEWRLEKSGSNSGIFLRAPRAGRSSKIGMEFQLMGDHGVPPEEHVTGAIYDVLSPISNAGRPVGEWNELEITLDGPKMKAVLNGEVVQDLSLDDNEELKYRLRNGFIGLQDHGHKAAFRNIRLKRL
ncbi:MAG TPA: DUF1080 domain-containing protein [Candidatus Hydrogenedentes bacterium]|nr:DUF1080 domain-containing protein [Candidatus Hydrogenedentota bacterium]HPG68253.1 DUF1080 domain-containing protein [Candidatus Hydrogenedentota bacterium]